MMWKKKQQPNIKGNKVWFWIQMQIVADESIMMQVTG